MRRRFLNGKRVMALALAFSMVVGEAGMVVAAPADSKAIETVSENDINADQAEDLDADKLAEPTKPGKVTNLRFETEAENGVIDNSVLTWNADPAAERYEIRVVGADGMEYASGSAVDEAGVSYLTYVSLWGGNSYDLDDLRYDDYSGYKLENNAYVLAKDAEDKIIGIKEGATYTVYIRATNSEWVDVTNADGTTSQKYKTVYGDWSDPVTYTLPVRYELEKVTDIKVVETANGGATLQFQKGRNQNVELEIKDAAGREYFEDANLKDGVMVGEYVTENYSGVNLNDIFYAYQYEVKEGNTYATVVRVDNGDGTTSVVKAFEPGQTYTIRLRGVVTVDGEKKVSDWSEAVTYTCKENLLPEKPGQFEFKYDSNEVVWSSAEGAAGYEVELKDAAGNWFATASWDSETSKYVLKNITTSSSRFDLDGQRASIITGDGSDWEYAKDAAGKDIVAGQIGSTYTVNVRSYNYKKDGETKQYSDWASYTVTIPQKSFEPTKVTGVRVANRGSRIVWDEEANAKVDDTTYQVEVKDAAGREYFKGWDIENDPTTNKEVIKYRYLSTVSTSTDGTDLTTYQLIDEEPSAVIHPETGRRVTSFEPGQTYTVRVRATRQMDVNGETKTVEGPWSDVVTYAVPSANPTSTGVNAKPAQVTGLWIQTEAKKDSTLTGGAVMRWNSVEFADRYEYEITDSKGNLYSYYPEYINNAYVTNYPESSADGEEKPYIYINNLSDIYSYSKAEGSAYAKLKNADGTYAKTFQVGETYTIRVRAINRYREYDQAAQTWKPAAVEYQGDWSAPVTYTPAKKASAVTNLSFVRADDYYYYFGYTADVVDSTVYYQIATDENFNSASLVKDWTAVLGNNKLAISKDDDDLKPATTYYVRVVNSIYGEPVKSLEATKYAEVLATAAVTSFTTEAETAPKNITGLKVYSEREDRYTLRFDAVLKNEDGDHYEIQIASDPNSANWSAITTDSQYVYKSSLSDGVNYLRAVAYVNRTNEVTGESEKIYGTPSNVITLTKNETVTSPIGKLKMAEEVDFGYYFSYSGNLRKDEDVELWYSDSKNFETNVKTVTTVINSSSSDANKKVYVGKQSLEPGKTYYVKARTYNSKATTTTDVYSAFSNVVKVKTTIPKVYVASSAVTKNSITISMSDEYDSWWVKGYEIQKKIVKGKKTTWETITRTSASTYTDKKLKADTTYSYRIRPYYFDDDTNKTTNGSWVYFEAMTGWGGALNLKVAPASKTSIKLNWNKITGAKGYEVYRCVTDSTDTQISNGDGNAYTEYKQIANLSSGKKSYTDKKLTSGMSYSYVVKAYKTVGGKKVYIEETGSASLDFVLNSVKNSVNTVRKSNGKVTVTWKPVYSAKGYLIEKYNTATRKWSTYKTIKKAKTSSYTFPKAKDTENGDRYRIRAYNGSKYTDEIIVDVDPVLAAPTSVKAKATKNGIKVSWKAVKGADYYRVYRTTSAKTVYDKDTKTYSYDGMTEVGRYIADKSQISGYRWRNLEEMNVTSVVDQKIVYSYNGVDNNTLYKGPDTGVKYYYYVVAYKNKPQHEYVYDNDDASSYASGNSKAASATFKEATPAKSKISKATSKSKSVTLTYKASKNADGYEIERSTSSKKGYTVIGEVNSGTKLTYKDAYNKKTNALKKGKTYYYRVRAFQYNDDGSKVYSAYSAVRKVKVK